MTSVLRAVCAHAQPALPGVLAPGDWFGVSVASLGLSGDGSLGSYPNLDPEAMPVHQCKLVIWATVGTEPSSLAYPASQAVQ